MMHEQHAARPAGVGGRFAQDGEQLVAVQDRQSAARETAQALLACPGFALEQAVPHAQQSGVPGLRRAG